MDETNSTSTLRWWLPTTALMLMSLLSYVDRNVLALLSPTILAETGLNAAEYGQIISAFSAAYLIGNPVWGRVLDRFGLRLGLAVAVALWTVASASHALADTVLGFAVARAALGFGEGATFPGGLRASAQTLAPDQRARGIALAYSGGSLGAVITPIVITPIALRWGWRGAFVVTGLFGVAWLGAWGIIARDRRLARQPAPKEATGAPRLMDRSVWGFMAAYALGGLPLGFVLYGAPIHLGRGLGCDQATLGEILWVPPLGWEVGYFFWGWRIDRAARQGPLGVPRLRRMLALLAVTAPALAMTPLFHSLGAVLPLLFWAMFVSSGFVIISLAETTRRHSERHGAYLAGLGAGSWSGVMAIAMPIFGRLFDRSAYRYAYAIAASAPVVGWLIWRILVTTPDAPNGVHPTGHPLERSSR